MNSTNITTHRQTLAGTLVIVIGLALAMPVPAEPSATPSSSPAEEMGVEVLSLSVSKLARGAFGNAINPFTGFGSGAGESGTMVFAKITPRLSTSLVLQADKCRLLSFKDDAGMVLLTNAAAELGSSVFPGNRPLEILTARDSGIFGLKLRSDRVPARTANRLIAEVLLVFSRSGEERVAQKTAVWLQSNEVVTIGPLKVKLTEQPVSASDRTNQLSAGTPATYWWARFLPEKETAIASVAFFSEKSDEPILVAKNLSGATNATGWSTGIYSMKPDPGSSRDGFSNRNGYGFRPPEDKKVSIKVRYYDVESLVEKRCVISTGLSP
jgi:hypothetical protein